jgi:diacylglycerol kinase (ATP)
MATRRYYLSPRFESFGFAARGIVALLRSEANARIHALATLLVCLVAFYLGISGAEWCCLVLAMVTVWSAEALNTALESLANAVAPAPHPLVKKAKDVAAGAVLFASVGSAIIGVLILGPRLWELVRR